jgi:multisubunit Na+/H+ antiporter MnhC subunit
MILAVIGLALCLWAISSGFGAPALGRTDMFVGPIGFVVNLAAVLIGFGLMAVGFGFVLL